MSASMIVTFNNLGPIVYNALIPVSWILPNILEYADF